MLGSAGVRQSTPFWNFHTRRCNMLTEIDNVHNCPVIKIRVLSGTRLLQQKPPDLLTLTTTNYKMVLKEQFNNQQVSQFLL